MPRLFISVDIESQETRKRITGMIEELKKAGLGREASFVPSENLHLSLKFLGDVPESRMKEVTGCIEAACAGVAPFELRIAGLGFFPEGHSLRHARVLFVKATTEPGGVLEGIAGRLSRELYSRRIGKRDDKPFASHITLARIRRPPLDSALPALEETMRRNDENAYIGAEVVNSVRLKESRLGMGRPPMYETRFNCELVCKAEKRNR